MKANVLGIGLIGLIMAGLLSSASAQNEGRRPVVVEGKKTLPLRVLVRPFSTVYEKADEKSPVVKENIPAFQPFYVYTKPAATDLEEATTWYEVGSDKKGTIVGWMKAADLMEWKQAMTLAYTHPDGRKPVMMFKDKDHAVDIIDQDPDMRSEAVTALYDAVDSGEIPKNFPLISMEPKRAVFMFIEEQFYLLPILDFEEIEIDGREGRLLKLAAATGAAAGPRKATTLEDTAFREAVSQDISGESDEIKNLRFNVVFVMDMTTSMQPYIDQTKEAIKEVAEKISGDKDLADNVLFGLWGYRDSTEIAGMEFVTKNFTDKLQTADSFAGTMDGVKAATKGSQGYEEDMFSGMDQAINATAWDDDAAKIIVLVGDAPSHPKDHKWNASGKGAEELRSLANDKRVNIFSVHLKNPKATKYHDAAEEQYSLLAANRGLSQDMESTYLAVPTDDLSAFRKATDQIVGVMSAVTADARKEGNISELLKETAPVVATTEEEEVELEQPDAEELTKAMLRAALVDWLGKEEAVQAPSDITAWVTDKDLIDPAIPSLEVRVLISKNDIDSLRTLLQELMLAGRSGQENSTDFFEGLQATSATLTVTPEQIASAKNLEETGLIPEFLLGLPYKSRIMGMKSEEWNDWSQDEQDELLIDLDAKIRYYGDLHDDASLWVSLNEGDDSGDHVYPISLDMLP